MGKTRGAVVGGPASALSLIAPSLNFSGNKRERSGGNSGFLGYLHSPAWEQLVCGACQKVLRWIAVTKSSVHHISCTGAPVIMPQPSTCIAHAGRFIEHSKVHHPEGHHLQSRFEVRERTLHLADLRAGRRQGLEEVGDEVLVRVGEVRQVRLHRLRYLQRQDLSATGPAYAADWQLQCTQTWLRSGTGVGTPRAELRVSQAERGPPHHYWMPGLLADILHECTWGA